MIRVDRVALVIALLSILVNFGHSISEVRESLSLKHYHTHYNPYILPLPTLTLQIFNMAEAEVDVEQRKTFFIKKRGILKGQLTKFHNYIQDLTPESDLMQLKLRLVKIQECWSEFEDVQCNLEILTSETSQSREREAFENSYFQIVAAAQTLIDDREQKPLISPVPTTDIIHDVSPGAQGPKLKLPTIALPTFSGNIDDYLPFLELFNALIHNNATLSDVQKLYYLKTSLKGDASFTLQSLPLTSQNYEVAKKLLDDRYGNKRIIINKHVSALFNQTQIKKESAIELQNLLDTSLTHVRALQALGQPTEQWSTLLIHILASKLDEDSLRCWEELLTPNDVPKFDTFIKFLMQRCHTLQALSSKQSKPTSKRCFVTNQNKCALCNDTHFLFQCSKFCSLSTADRFQTVKRLGHCINSLSYGHQLKSCTSSKNCKYCSQRHNSLLHFEKYKNVNNQGTKVDLTNKDPVQGNHNSSQTKVTNATNTSFHNNVLLSTAIVKVKTAQGHFIKCRALLDSASQATLLTESFCNKLQLQKSKQSIPISGINSQDTQSSYEVDVTMKSCHSNYKVSFKGLVIKQIVENLPSSFIDISNWNIPSDLPLADSEFFKPREVDMLIGCDLFWDVLCNGRLQLNSEGTLLLETKLGWIFAGILPKESNFTNMVCNLTITENLNKQLEKFWQVEEMPTDIEFSSEHELCEQHFTNNTTRNKDGRYIVKMPTKGNLSHIGESKNRALRRFYMLESKLERNPELHEQYSSFMKEYEKLGHMEIIDNETTSNPTYYIPHHPVVRDESITTKLRVVFDGSALTTATTSLNQNLHVGPVIHDDLFAILLRFRTHNYVFSADVEKMFRQIWIDESQEDLQQIVWRENKNKPIKMYKLKTVTYSLASSLYLATCTLSARN